MEDGRVAGRQRLRRQPQSIEASAAGFGQGIASKFCPYGTPSLGELSKGEKRVPVRRSLAKRAGNGYGGEV